MKSFCFTILLLIFGLSFISPNSIAARDSTALFVFNAGVNIYSQKEQSPNYFLYPTPEIEVLYIIHSFKRLSVFTGVQYTYSYGHHDLGYKSEWRRIAHELAFPLFVEQNIGNYISIEGGAVIGYLIKGKEEYKNNIPAQKVWKNVTNQTDYNESSKIYFELCFNPRFKYDFDAWNTISIGPIFSYKIKDNWLKQIRHKSMIGIAFCYSYQL